MRIPKEAKYGVDRHQTDESIDSRIYGSPMVTVVSPELYRKNKEFGPDTGRHSGTRLSYDQQRERKYGRAQFSECKTTGKGLMYVKTTKFVFHQMDPSMTGRRKH